MTSTRDIAWLAGILDGEGCILARLANRANATGGNIAVEVRVEVTSRAMTSKMQKVLSDLGVQFGVCESRPKLATKEVFRTCVSNKKDVQVLLKAVLPDLSTKRPEAELALAWYERWPDQRGTGTLRATYEEKLAFKAALAALKRTARTASVNAEMPTPSQAQGLNQLWEGVTTRRDRKVLSHERGTLARVMR